MALAHSCYSLLLLLVALVVAHADHKASPDSASQNYAVHHVRAYLSTCISLSVASPWLKKVKHFEFSIHLAVHGSIEILSSMKGVEHIELNSGAQKQIPFLEYLLGKYHYHLPFERGPAPEFPHLATLAIGGKGSSLLPKELFETLLKTIKFRRDEFGHPLKKLTFRCKVTKVQQKAMRDLGVEEIEVPCKAPRKRTK